MSVLREIFATKANEVAEARSRTPLAELKSRIGDASPARGFRQALESADRDPALIAEIKSASPSMGVIRAGLDAEHIAQSYAKAGAHALSVLTDVSYFHGSPTNLVAARQAVELPVLRKDFLFDPYQIYEARAWGSDAILLIVAALSVRQLADLRGLARDLGMDALVEVHTIAEAEMALESGADLVGINNRNLADFETDLATTERVAPSVKNHALIVSESALASPTDVERVRSAGARAVLIGTCFCMSDDIEQKVREVMGW